VDAHETSTWVIPIYPRLLVFLFDEEDVLLCPPSLPPLGPIVGGWKEGFFVFTLKYGGGHSACPRSSRFMTKPPCLENDTFVAHMAHVGRNSLLDMFSLC